MHGITMSSLHRALLKITLTGTSLSDYLGQHNSHALVLESRRNFATDQINSFPSVSSHYSRKNNPNSKYLEEGVKNKTHMYKLYKRWMGDNHPGEDIATNHYYFDILKKTSPD